MIARELTQLYCARDARSRLRTQREGICKPHIDDWLTRPLGPDAARKHYAGIGSRATPPTIRSIMTALAIRLRLRAYRLRSGGAVGADSAFARGAGLQADIYLPWAGFNNIASGIVCGENSRLREIAARTHPAWEHCSAAARKLHTRNVAQILGAQEGDPISAFVACWTPGGRGGGGTGQAIRVAKLFAVPVYDLGRDGELDRLMDALR